MARHARRAGAAAAAGEAHPVLVGARRWVRRAGVVLAVAAGTFAVYVVLQVTAPFRSVHRPVAALPARTTTSGTAAATASAEAPGVPVSPDAGPTPPAAGGSSAGVTPVARSAGASATEPAGGASRAVSPVTTGPAQYSSSIGGSGQTAHAAPVAPVLTGPPTQGPPVLRSPVTGAVLAVFGWAYSPVFADWQEHAGVDLASPVGGTAVAPAAGVVLQVRQDSLWGWVVSINLGGGYSTNVSGLERVSVHAGQAVRAGQPIGTVGASPPAESELAAHVFWQLFAGATPLNPLGG